MLFFLQKVNNFINLLYSGDKYVHLDGVPLNKTKGKIERIYTMNFRKTFISPRVLQTCEVVLETNLLGGSNDVEFTSHGIETTGQQTTLDNSYSASDWQAGSDFD